MKILHRERDRCQYEKEGLDQLFNSSTQLLSFSWSSRQISSLYDRLFFSQHSFRMSNAFVTVRWISYRRPSCLVHFHFLLNLEELKWSSCLDESILYCWWMFIIMKNLTIDVFQILFSNSFNHFSTLTVLIHMSSIYEPFPFDISSSLDLTNSLMSSFNFFPDLSSRFFFNFCGSELYIYPFLNFFLPVNLFSWSIFIWVFFRLQFTRKYCMSVSFLRVLLRFFL